jgi:hypothetical protein
MASSRTEELCVTMRRSPLLLPVVPVESAISVPVAMVRSGIPYLRFLVYMEKGEAGEPIGIYRPYIRLTVEWESGKFVELADLRVTEGVPATATAELLGEFSPDTGMGYQARVQMLKEFYSLTDDLLPAIGKKALPEERRVAARRYGELMSALVPPPLLNSCKTLSPDLFSWLLGQSI